MGLFYSFFKSILKMRIALFGTQFNSAKAKYVQHLVNKLEQENIKLIIENQFYDNQIVLLTLELHELY